MSVCLRNYLGGEVFTIHDVTGGAFTLLELDDRFNGHSTDMRGNVTTTKKIKKKDREREINNPRSN